FAMEVLRLASWCVVLIVLLSYLANATARLKAVLSGLVIYCALVWIVPMQLDPSTRLVGTFKVLSLLLLALLALVLIEQLYRNVDAQQRWGIKYFCLGLGAMFACDF